MKALITSDIHFHPWSLFSNVLPSGVNSRLQIVIEELLRGARQILTDGGSVMIISGDVFHARGSIDPEVLNPVRQCFDDILQMGVSIYIIPGNHDLKSADTVKLSSSIQNLQQVDAIGGAEIRVINKACLLDFDDGTVFGFAPWRDKKEALMADLAELSKDPRAKDAHVFVHVGIDGVLSGVPAHNLPPSNLSAFGFKGIYAGHYHNHADMSAGLPNRVMSIGATTHHNWGDVDTRAGFLVMDTKSNEVVFHDTLAPKFVDISGYDEADMEIEAAGNYVRFRGPQMTQEQVNELRDTLKDWGALGVSIEVPRKIDNGRSTAPTTGLTLDQSVGKFVDEMKDVPPSVDRAEIARRAAEVLSMTRSVTTEA